MGKWNKLREKILLGNSDANIRTKRSWSKSPNCPAAWPTAKRVKRRLKMQTKLCDFGLKRPKASGAKFPNRAGGWLALNFKNG